MTPPMIPGYGMSSGFEFYLQDKLAGDVHEFKKVADAFIAALSERPEIGQVYSSFKTDYPQYCGYRRSQMRTGRHHFR